MSINQHEAVNVLNHTIFRPGWSVSARPAPGDSNEVMACIEIMTVDSSFVTRGGEYQVPLTERTFIIMDVRDYETPEALLFRVLCFLRELQGHEDREFLRAWDGDAERWVAPFHSHTPEGRQAWERLRELPEPAVARVDVAEAGPWKGCDQEDDKGDCWESGNAGLPARAVSPCNEQDDGDDDDGPQRLVAGCAEADDAALTECTEQRRVLAHAAAHPVRVAGCNECDGGCASWG